MGHSGHNSMYNDRSDPPQLHVLRNVFLRLSTWPICFNLTHRRPVNKYLRMLRLLVFYRQLNIVTADWLRAGVIPHEGPLNGQKMCLASVFCQVILVLWYSWGFGRNAFSGTLQIHGLIFLATKKHVVAKRVAFSIADLISFMLQQIQVSW